MALLSFAEEKKRLNTTVTRIFFFGEFLTLCVLKIFYIKRHYDENSQDSWFNYLFGVKEPGFLGAIRVRDGYTVLFMPKLDPSYRIWCGEIFPPQYFKEMYAVDEVLFTEDIQSWVAAQLEGTSNKIHVLSGKNSDSGKEPATVEFEGFQSFVAAGKVSDSAPDLPGKTSVLYQALSTARLTKSDNEVDVMHYAAYVASNAHVEVMRSVKGMQYEYEVEAKFLYEIYRNGGCRKSAYTSICACGPNSSVLHYGHAAAPNDRAIGPNDTVLFDMGAEYHGYVSDITCSVSISVQFSSKDLHLCWYICCFVVSCFWPLFR